MDLLKNRYILISSENDYFIMKWNLETAKMSEEEYKSILLEYVKLVNDKKPVGLLLDIINLRFLITPEIQEWTNKFVFANTFASGLKKVAILEAKDVVTQLSAEQTFEEEIALKKKNRFFVNRNEALAWLLE